MEAMETRTVNALKLAVLLLMGALFASLRHGCDDAGGGKTSIRFWCGFTGPDGRTMLRLIKRFNRENPDVHVLMQRMDWSTYYNKLFVAGLGGRAPEVFISHVDNLERFRRANFLEPVDPFLSGDHGIDENELLPNIWEAVEREGQHFGLPLDIHPLGLYYNKNLFREAGLVDAAGNPLPPATREEFLDAARRLRKDKDHDGVVDQWGYVFTWHRTNVFTVMKQFGGAMFNEDASASTLADPRNVEALQFCADLIHKHKVAPSPENFDSWIGFRQGRVGMVFEGVYMLADLQKQTDLDFGAAPVPTLGHVPAAWASSHIMCMRAELTQEKKDASWRLMRFLSNNSLDWAQGGQIPARRELLESGRFEEMPVQSAFAEQLDRIEYAPRVPFVFEFFREFDFALDRALRGSVAPLDALREAEKQVNRTIQRQRELMDEMERDRRE